MRDTLRFVQRTLEFLKSILLPCHRYMYNHPHETRRAPAIEPTLRRGMACLSCRRRKSKCGGEQPSCRQCVRLGRAASCEYDNSRRARSESSAQALELDESNPQSPTFAREHSPESSRSVFLHDPHAAYHGSQVLFQTTSQEHGANAQLFPLVPIPESLQGDLNWWDMDEPPPTISDALVSHFAPHRHRLGFALNMEKFITSMRLPQGHPERAHAALTSAVYLWGLLLTPSNAPTPLGNTGDARENASKVLNRAVLALSEWSGDLPQKRMHAVQAEILIAQYLFYECRYLEGLVHISASVTMAIGCSLHKIRYPFGDLNPTVPATGDMRLWTPFELPPPRDMEEMRERMDLFRTVLIMDKCWSVAVRISPCSENTRLDGSWMRNDVPNVTSTSGSPVASSSAVQLERQNTQVACSAVLVQQIQAACLYVEAERRISEVLSRSHSPSAHSRVPGGNDASRSSPESVPRFLLEHYQAINAFIESLQSTPGQFVATPSTSSNIPPSSQSAMSISNIVAETLAHGAKIRLFRPYMNGNADALATINQSALRVVFLMETSIRDAIASLDPVVAMVWNEVAHALAFNARHSLDTRRAVDPVVSSAIIRMISALRAASSDMILSHQSNKLLEFLQQTLIPQTQTPRR